MAEPRTRLRVGRLTKAHGLKGALKLELYTDDPERRFVPGATFSLQVPPESPWHGKQLTLRELRWYNGHPVGFFEGIDDRTAAESIVKAILWVERVDDEAPEPDAWYDHQLVGLTVLRDGRAVGEVAHVDHLPAQDLLVVKTGGGREVMVPFVSAIVPEVDVDAGTLTVTPPRGLFEDDEAESAPEGDHAAEDGAEPEGDHAAEDGAESDGDGGSDGDAAATDAPAIPDERAADEASDR